MKSMVVLFALVTVAYGSVIPQPAHHPAILLDPHGRPLDTAEVINNRAVHLQAKALEGHGSILHAGIAPIAHSVVTPVAHSVVAPAVVAAPLVSAHAGLLGHSALGYAGHGHLIGKRSLGHIGLTAPVLSHAIAAPVIAHAIAPAAVSHQSRVDVRTSPAVVAHSVIATPVHTAHSVLAAPIHGAHSVLGAHAGLALSHGHFLKKRSLAHILPVAHTVPAAVSHQSRVDVVSSPAVVSHAVAAPIVAHAAPALVATAAHVAPLVHSAAWAAPAAHLSHSGLLHGAHW